MDCNITNYNLSYILEKYDEIKASGLKYTLVHFNVKNFRYYVTKYGSETADEILGILFNALLGILKDKEYAAYLYADNFVALMHYDDINDFVYNRMVGSVDNLYRIEDERIYRNVFFSFGIYEIKEKDIRFQDAFNYANLCRRESETIANRSYCMEVYDEKFYHKYMDQMELQIKTADAYKNYEFIPFLQPKVDLENEEVVSAEALLRWFDKDGNAVPLYQFLPILNQNSYISLVDLDIFEHVCKLLERRLKEHKKVVPVSFNISKAHFYNPDILKNYVEIFEKYDVPKELIEMEFMESISLNDTEHMKKVISSFKEYGFTCSLDDFGNGYSSFNVLLNANLDIVKMDRQFFLNNLNGDDRLVIKTMVDLIHSLNMEVVAEGVELKEHIEFLKECGCDVVQGYYYYKPMPLDKFEAVLDQDTKEKCGVGIREIKPKDDAQVEHLIRTCLIEFGWDKPGCAWEDPDLGRFSEIYQAEGRKYWVVEKEGEIIGGCGIGPVEQVPGVCELQKMYCLPEARGTGAALELLQLALLFAKRYYKRCYLETFTNMTAANKFYVKHGFQPLDHPLIESEHYACDKWYIMDL